MSSLSVADDNLVAEVLDGRRKSIARLMSLAESTGSGHREALAEIHRHAGKAHIVGLTGVPGSGKSTMVRALGQKLREMDRKVGIVAIDPSSPFSGGAILGDRIRMSELTGDPGVFIRSMATRGELGGLARASLDLVDILDAAGYDLVLVETVGVGQDEVDIVQAAHSVIVVSAPGLGDEVQAIKAGVLEIADIHVVSKCDRPDAMQTVSNLRAMLKLGAIGRGVSTWRVPVVSTSAQNRDGIDELVATIDSHRDHLITSGEIEERRRKILEMRILKVAEDIVRARLLGQGRRQLDRLITEAMSGDIDPYTAACNLLEIDTSA
jgi:LAO/AO transport system kinase